MAISAAEATRHGLWAGALLALATTAVAAAEPLPDDDALLLRAQVNRLAVGNRLAEGEREELRRRLQSLEQNLDSVVGQVLTVADGVPLAADDVGTALPRAAAPAERPPLASLADHAPQAGLSLSAGWWWLLLPLLLMGGWVLHQLYYWGTLFPWRR